MVRKCDESSWESLAWYRDGMGDWLWSRGTPDSSAKFTQRGSRDEVGSSVPLCHWAHRMPTFEALTKGTFCTSRGKQCLHIRECPGRSLQFLSRMPLCFGTFFSTPNLGQHHPRYMCTTDPSQCSTETCHCEDPSHIRKALSCWCNLGQPVKSSSRANVSLTFTVSMCNICMLWQFLAFLPGDADGWSIHLLLAWALPLWLPTACQSEELFTEGGNWKIWLRCTPSLPECPMQLGPKWYASWGSDGTVGANQAKRWGSAVKPVGCWELRSPAPCSAEPCECKPGFLKAGATD